MILYIDATDFNQVVFAIKSSKDYKKSYQIEPHKSSHILNLLDQFLKSGKVKPKEIKKIVVNKGPGSFTGVRVSLSIAQALGLAWNVPVKAVAKEKFKI